MKMLRTLASAALVLAAVLPASAGRHLGETKDLDVDIQYFDYAYLLPNGEPVYYLGTTMRYKVVITNTGNRSYNRYTAESALRWINSTSCTMWWYDNQPASFTADQLLPGNSSSGQQSMSMGKQGSSQIDATYAIPLSVCPNRVRITIEGRHINESGREEVASFSIPVGAEFRKR